MPDDLFSAGPRARLLALGWQYFPRAVVLRWLSPDGYSFTEEEVIRQLARLEAEEQHSTPE